MENAKHRIRRLSAKFNYYDVFEYMVDWRKTANVSGVIPFHYARKWCNETWGFGTDVDSHVVAMLAGEQVNPCWAYCAQYDQYRIYLAGDAELSWFKLRHGPGKHG
jgi:hypothetical protein